MKYKRGITHCVAYCLDCGWSDEDFKHARKHAYQHHKRTGHDVSIEVCYAIQYKNPHKKKEATDGK